MCIDSTDPLAVALDLPCHRCFLPLVIGDGPNIVTCCCQTSFGPDCWRWHLTSGMLLGMFSRESWPAFRPGFTVWTNEVILFSSLSPCCPSCVLIAATALTATSFKRSVCLRIGTSLYSLRGRLAARTSWGIEHCAGSPWGYLRSHEWATDRVYAALCLLASS